MSASAIPRAAAAFDPAGPLPEGTTVLEASAGTGKTYTIAGLAARYIAEGVGLPDLMIVTFSRAASQELRSRVRSRLSQVERDLARALAAQPVDEPDEVTEVLLTGSLEVRQLRLTRIRRALAEFDAATIATTHEFCARMLRGLGMLTDDESDTVFVDDISELVRQCADDLYLARYGDDPNGPAFDIDTARQIAARVAEWPAVRILDFARPWRAAERTGFAQALRGELERRKRRLGISTYDDLLTRLADALQHPDAGELARQRLSAQFRVVLIDEFQDTDPVQWSIIENAFHGRSTVVLIGDPKQAIYGFRGADVYSYLDAVAQADAVLTLDTNYRADAPVVAAVHDLFDGAGLGDPRIPVRSVRAAHPARIYPPSGSPWEAPLRIRLVDEGELSAGQARRRVETDLVSDIADLLRSGTRLSLNGVDRPIEASDVAVLVQSNRGGERLRDALISQGIPAVFIGSTNVFESPAARDWLTLLRALHDPRAATVRLASLTAFGGWTFTDLVGADEEALDVVGLRLRDWARVWDDAGVAAVFEAALTQVGLTSRLLAYQHGERLLTDLRHVAQLLHAAETGRRLGHAGLIDWLADRIRDSRAAGDDRLQRLESDAACVHIMTIHRSKGLEFPVVYLPDVWGRWVDDQPKDVIVVHERDDEGRLHPVLDASKADPASPNGQRHRFEEAGDDLRKLYVSLTRAQCQVTLWWARTKVSTYASPLERVLSATREGGVPAVRVDELTSPTDVRRLDGTGVARQPVGAGQSSPLQAPAGVDTPTLTARRWLRDIDHDWRRTSYSGLTSLAHGAPTPAPAAPHADEQAIVTLADEPVADTGNDATSTVEPTFDGPFAEVPALAPFPGGTTFGTLVHAMFEAVDPSAPTVSEDLRRIASPLLARFPLAGVDAEALAGALEPVLATRLGPLADERTLTMFTASDRLCELDFEYPLGSLTTSADLHAVADLLQQTLAPGDPMACYAQALRDPLLDVRPLRGFLTGSIDAVLRLPDQRHLVVDYKTNRLAPPEHELRFGHYRPESLTEAMIASHYPLQALLYCVALHRFLRWRMPGYDPAEHLGGVVYLFVRGMGGSEPLLAGTGVFGWRPPAELVMNLSDLLAGGRS